jgi:anthranilate phosphoribosyltransferase
MLNNAKIFRAQRLISLLGKSGAEQAERPMIREVLEKVLSGEDLTRAEAEAATEEFLSGRATRAQRVAFHTALAMKGQTSEEAAGIATALTRHGNQSEKACAASYDSWRPDFSDDFLLMQGMVAEGNDLSARAAQNAMQIILSGGAQDEQIAAFLTAMRFKGETADELVGFAMAMRRHAPKIFADGHPIAEEALIDTCGTGGDGHGTFNISTATAFVVAGAGVRVAKHGNRSASSVCGSADVLEHLGMRIDLSALQVARAIEQIGIGFLFAQAMHSATRHVAKVRRELGFRTVFNLLGPLTNPAGASAQVVGVYDAGVTELMAESLGELGVKRAFVVHGADGLDEITISGETYVSELCDSKVRNYTVTPEDFGVKRAPLAAIRGGDAAQNAGILHKILGRSLQYREHTAHRDIVLANASAALVAAGRAEDFRQGVRLAAQSIDSGAAREKLERLIAFSQTQSAQSAP